MRPTVREETGATFMLRCTELGLTCNDLEGMTMGMVFDMLIERANDQEKYPFRGQPGTLKSFFAGGGRLG
jgi:hypothetical protein